MFELKITVSGNDRAVLEDIPNIPQPEIRNAVPPVAKTVIHTDMITLHAAPKHSP